MSPSFNPICGVHLTFDLMWISLALDIDISIQIHLFPHLFFNKDELAKEQGAKGLTWIKVYIREVVKHMKRTILRKQRTNNGLF